MVWTKTYWQEQGERSNDFGLEKLSKGWILYEADSSLREGVELWAMHLPVMKMLPC